MMLGPAAADSCSFLSPLPPRLWADDLFAAFCWFVQMMLPLLAADVVVPVAKTINPGVLRACGGGGVGAGKSSRVSCE